MYEAVYYTDYKYFLQKVVCLKWMKGIFEHSMNHSTWCYGICALLYKCDCVVIRCMEKRTICEVIWGRKQDRNFIQRCKIEKDEKKMALAGNRTRICCLESNNAHHYTTNAFQQSMRGRVEGGKHLGAHHITIKIQPNWKTLKRTLSISTFRRHWL